MNESSVRAERYDSEAAAPPAFTWAVPQKPVAVRVRLDLLEKLEREAVESYRSLTSRGSESGGVLWGAVVPGNPALVVVESYEPVACDYATGPLYRLGTAELARLDQALKQRHGKLEPVGFFRSHTRKALSLDAEDMAMLNSRFGGPFQVVLLIHPSKKGSTGAFFIRENGVLRGGASYLEFPIHTRESETAAGEGEVAGPRAVAAAPAMPAAGRPVARAQIVPIATRREIVPLTPASAPLPEPVPPLLETTAESKLPVEPATPAGPATAPAAKAVAEPVAAPAPVPAANEPAAAPVAERRPQAEKTPGIDAPLPGRNLLTAEAPAATKAAEPRAHGRLLWLAIGAMIPAMLSMGLFLTSGILGWRRPSLPAPASEPGLALRVERNAGDILLTWNRDADAIRRATRAVLSISDGAQHENVEMDLSQLRTGSIVYSPVTSDVVFRMEVNTSGQSDPVSETVRVLRTRPSPMPETATAGPAGNPEKAAAATGAAPPSVEESSPAEDTKVTLAQPLKKFHAETLAQRLRAARPSDLPEAPVLAAAPKAPAFSDVNLGGIVGNAAAPPPPAPKPEPVKAPATGGQVQPAQLLHRVNPVFPRMAQQTGASGTVEVVATIGLDGRVRDVRVVSGNALLRQAAVDAVKQWIYRPTILNGRPVESQTQVSLDFRNPR